VENFDKVLDQIRKLLALADHPNTPPHEADLARARAEAKMLQYRIEEATLVSKGIHGNSNGGLTPVWRTLTIANSSSEFADYYRSIAASCLTHVGGIGVTKWENGYIILDACGYLTDLTYLDVLMTACLLEFGKRLEPKFDPSISIEENIYNMRSAGMERKRIARIVFGEWETENEMKAKNRKVTRIFKEESLRRGENPDDVLGRGNNMQTFRRSYADGFKDQINMRLWRMRTSVGEDSKALVLADRKEKVREAFYEKYPQYRPQKQTESPLSSEPCPKCAKAKSGYCRAHKPLKFKDEPVSHAGRSRGKQAALMVDLGPNATGAHRTGSSTRKEIN
jgi:hypothetical protein